MVHSQVWRNSVRAYNQWLQRRGFDMVPNTAEEQSLLQLDQDKTIPVQTEGWDLICTNVGSERYTDYGHITSSYNHFNSDGCPG